MPFLPYFVHELGINDTKQQLVWSGWLITSAGITMAIVSPIWGVLADRHGRKIMVVRSMFGGVVVLGAMAFVHNVYQLLILRMLQGALTGTIAASVALVASVVPTRRSGLALGLMQNAMFIGAAIGPAIGGPLGDHFGYRLCFEVSAGILLVGALLTVFAVHEEFDPTEAQNSEGATTNREVLAITGFATMVGLLFMVQFSGSFVGPILPLYIQQISHLAKAGAASGLIFSLSAVAAGLAAVFLGLLGDKVGYSTILVSCTFLDGLTLIPQAMVHSFNQLLVSRVVFAACDGGTMPAANAFIRKLVPRHACGKAFGIVTSVTSIGWASGPLVGSYIAACFGMRVPFYFVAGTFLIVSVIVAFTLPRMMRAIEAEKASAAAAECPLDSEVMGEIVEEYAMEASESVNES